MFLLYNFPIMLKALAIVVFLGVVLPIYGEKESAKSGSNETTGNDLHSPSLKTGTAITCVVKKEGTSIECDWPEAVTQSYFKRLLSPENTPNILLFLAGLGGVFAAVLTLRAINRQADLMEAQARMQEKTLVLQFRPKIVIRVGKLNPSVVAPVLERAKGALEITIANIGGSNARILGGSFD